MISTRLQEGVEHLVIPALLTEQAIIFEPNACRIFARDVSRAEQHVPEEQQIAEISFVISDANGAQTWQS